MRYYIADETQPKGFLEVTESEYNALFGAEPIRPYVHGVYNGTLALEAVPLEHQAAVRAAVANMTSRWGPYKDEE